MESDLELKIDVSYGFIHSYYATLYMTSEVIGSGGCETFTEVSNSKLIDNFVLYLFS